MQSWRNGSKMLPYISHIGSNFVLDGLQSFVLLIQVRNSSYICLQNIVKFLCTFASGRARIHNKLSQIRNYIKDVLMATLRHQYGLNLCTK